MSFVCFCLCVLRDVSLISFLAIVVVFMFLTVIMINIIRSTQLSFEEESDIFCAFSDAFCIA